MLLIGLTGGIASGKSTVSRVLQQLGAPVIDADAIVHELQEPGGRAFAAIVEAFGTDVVGPDGRLNRAALGERVFGDPKERRRLEAIVHPLVAEEMGARVAALAYQGEKAAVLDVPLLFEVGMNRGMGEIWVVYVDPETQVRRLMDRDGLSPEAARRRIAAQWPLEKKAAQADVVIDNRGGLEQTRAQVERAWQEALTRARDRGTGGAGQAGKAAEGR